MLLRRKNNYQYWKKIKESFGLIKDYKEKFYNLYNINEWMFLSMNYNNFKEIFSFYKTEKYYKIRYIIIPIVVDFI